MKFTNSFCTARRQVLVAHAQRQGLPLKYGRRWQLALVGQEADDAQLADDPVFQRSVPTTKLRKHSPRKPADRRYRYERGKRLFLLSGIAGSTFHARLTTSMADLLPRLVHPPFGVPAVTITEIA